MLKKSGILRRGFPGMALALSAALGLAGCGVHADGSASATALHSGQGVCEGKGGQYVEANVVGLSRLSGANAFGFTNLRYACLQDCQVVFIVKKDSDLDKIKALSERISRSCMFVEGD